jgi:transposase-like protein
MGTQQYRYCACKKRILKDYTNQDHIPEVKTQCSQMAISGNGIRDTTRVLKLNLNSPMNHLKKAIPFCLSSQLIHSLYGISA